MKFTKTILKNGLRVITVPIQDNPAVTVLVMVEAGSKYETKETNGISHFLEHMVFKGTPRRPMASDISKELDGLGAQYNAFTSQEFTGYYAKVDPKHFDHALDIITDMYQNPLFEEGEINKEKGVITEEIKMYNDLPQKHVHDVLSELMFGNQPAGWSVLGPEKNIRSFNKKTFMDYRKQNYVSSATTVIVAGAVKEKEALKKIEKIFSKISKDEKKKKLPVKESQKKPEIKIFYKDTDQTHLIIALRTFPINDKRMPVMRVLSAVLGQGMSSRLFSKMRDQLGICYYIKAYHDASTDHGHIAVTAGVDNKRVDIGIKNILIELKRMTEELVSDKELKKVKDYISGTTMLELETSDAQADYVGYQEILKREIKTPDEILREVNKVTAEDIRKLARQIFINKNLNMAIIGPYKDKKRFDKLITFDILNK